MISNQMPSNLPDKQRIVITGIGLTAPNGNNLREMRESLLNGRSGVSRYEIRYVGETLAGICNFDAKKYQSAGWRTARIIQTPDEVAPNESLCPVDVAKYNRKEPSTNCAKCRKCFAGGSDNIAFVQLGNKK